MIYVSTTYAIVAKKSLKDKCFQASLEKIKEILPNDPGVSGMDALIIAPKDIQGITGNSMVSAIKAKHEKVIVIYIYQKNNEEALLPDGTRIMKIKLDRPSPQDIERLVAESIANDVSAKKESLISSDRIKPADIPSQGNQGMEDAFITEVKKAREEVIAAAEPVVEEEVVHESGGDLLEERIRKCGEYADWNFFKEALKRDTVVKELINENTQFAGALNMLGVLERQISTVFRDPRKPPEEKFWTIKEIGLDRSAYKATVNSILTDKIANIITAIISSASSTVDRQVENIRSSLDKMVQGRVTFGDAEELQALIRHRLELQTQLLELSREIIEVYKTMDASVEDVIERFSTNLPSDNDYINEVMKPIKVEFTPQNAAVLAGRLLFGLQSGRINLHALESKITAAISLVFKLCEADDTIIDYQNKLIQLLSAQRVEDVVIVDTLLKNALRLYIGPSEVGRTATCLTWCSILSRRQNCLLIDLTGSCKFAEYGVETISLDKFLSERIERPFVCVEGSEASIEDVDRLVGELKLRLNYYPYVNIILDASQTGLIKELSQSALSVHFITNCTPRSMTLTKNAIKSLTTENIARKLIFIDPPITPADILHELSVDPLIYKVITIPYLAQIKACALRGMNPADAREISVVYEEAFR